VILEYYNKGYALFHLDTDRVITLHFYDATGYGLDDQEVGVQVPVGSRIFSSHVVQTRLGSTQPPIR
jgi:hypothetical protein